MSIVFADGHDPENRRRARAAALINRGRSVLRDIARGRHDDARAQRTALNAFAIRVISAGIIYGAQILIARLLGEKDYGVYVLVWSCVLIFGGISSLGFSVSIARFVPEYKERGESALLRGVITTVRVDCSTCLCGHRSHRRRPDRITLCAAAFPRPHLHSRLYDVGCGRWRRAHLQLDQSCARPRLSRSAAAVIGSDDRCLRSGCVDGGRHSPLCGDRCVLADRDYPASPPWTAPQ